MRLTQEKKLWKQGFSVVAGIDEAGRGPLAGPVVACALSVKPGFRSIAGVNDSKLLTARQRNSMHALLISHADIQWGIGIVSEKLIDKVNIFQATKLAMKRALVHLEKKINNRKLNDREVFCYADYLILDGNMKLDISVPQKSIIKGDQKIFSCAAASIIAKVTRDRIMERYHIQYPQYGFQNHKGYGTKLHFEKLRIFGPSPIHRMSFAPCKDPARLAKASNP